MKHTAQHRSGCPINYSLELLGDAWSLLIIRDMIYFGKRTFGEFLSSEEGIARNILTDRLEKLQRSGLIVKSPHPDGRKDTYSLTEQGLDLIPLLFEAADWGVTHGSDINAPVWWVEAVRAHRQEIIAEVKDAVRQGRAVFVGEHPVAARYQPVGA